MALVKLPSMSREEIDQLIKEQFLCRIAFRGESNPYIAPFQYAWVNERLFFHFTDYGTKISLLKEGAPVCVEIERYTPNLSEYAFVTLTGTLRLVEEEAERLAAIQSMAETGIAKLSTNFLCAHGLESRVGWSSFNAEQPILIVRLESVTSVKGLKSP